MHDVIKRDIIAVLTRFSEIIKVKDNTNFLELKELSNHVIHNASAFQDEDSVSVAVLIYSLSKIIERQQNFDYARVFGMMESCIANLLNDNDEGFRKSMKNIFVFIRTVDQKLRMYINEVINQAQIKKGCKLCEHGISVARAAEVLGISQWELMHYLGKTMLIDQFSEPVNASQRLKFTRELFS